MKTKPLRSQEPHSSKRKLFLPLLLGGIMVFSTFAIIFSGSNTSTPGSYKYHNIYFTSSSQGWQATVQGFPLVLQSGPKEVELLYKDLSFSPAMALLGTQKIYLSSSLDSTTQASLREFYVNGNIFPPLTVACTAEGPGCEDLPLKTCSDAVGGTGVLIFAIGSEDKITTEGTCVTLTGSSSSSLLQMTDKLIYTLYGVF